MHHSLKLYSRHREGTLKFYMFGARMTRLPLIGLLVRWVANAYGRKLEGGYLLTPAEAEKIVDSDVIKSSPHLTIVPAHKVAAVVECPFGAHPSELAGHYDYDMPFRALFVASSQSPEGMRAWLDEWIYGVSDRKEYIEHYVEKFGGDTLETLKSKPFVSTPADYGFPFTRIWDEDDNSEQLGMSMEEFIEMLDKKGVLIDGD